MSNNAYVPKGNFEPGTLVHGTSPEAALAIVRKGFIVPDYADVCFFRTTNEPSSPYLDPGLRKALEQCGKPTKGLEVVGLVVVRAALAADGSLFIDTTDGGDTNAVAVAAHGADKIPITSIHFYNPSDQRDVPLPVASMRVNSSGGVTYGAGRNYKQVPDWPTCKDIIRASSSRSRN